MQQRAGQQRQQTALADYGSSLAPETDAQIIQLGPGGASYTMRV